MIKRLWKITGVTCFFFVGGLCGRAGAQALPAISAILNNVSQDSLLQYVKEVTGAVPVMINGMQDTIKTRQYGTAGNEKAALFLKEKMLGFGLTVDSQVYNGSGGKNILARIPGTTSPGKVVILCAHYDNVGAPVSQGADDNGSGLAALIEAARVCRSSPQLFTLLFAFWDEEEIGVIGSGAYANAFLGSGQELIGCINLDQVGYDGNNDSRAEVHVLPVAGSAALSLRAQSVNTLYNIGLDLQAIQPGSLASDQTSFWNKSLTAIALAESYNTDITPYRHTLNDTVGTLNIPYMTKLAKLAIGTALTTASLGVNDRSNAGTAQITAFPSPFGDRLTLEVNDAAGSHFTAVVSDILGRVIVGKTVKRGEACILQTAAWPSGVYTIVLKDAGGRAAGVKKVVK